MMLLLFALIYVACINFILQLTFLPLNLVAVIRKRGLIFRFHSFLIKF